MTLMAARDVISSSQLVHTTWMGSYTTQTSRKREILDQVITTGLGAFNRRELHRQTFRKVVLTCPFSDLSMVTTRWRIPDPTEFFVGWWGWPAGLVTASWPAIDDSDKTVTLNLALERLNEKVRGSVDITVDAFQNRQTRAIAGDVKKIINSLRTVRNPKALLKVGGTAWLTWIYGVKPTLQTIYEATHSIARHCINGQLFEGTAKFSAGESNLWEAQWPNANFKDVVETADSYRVKFAVVLAIPENSLTNMAQFASLNPASIAWELMPWSFVVDWVINIGGFLRDLETACLYNNYFKQGYRTVGSKTSFQLTALPQNYEDGDTGWSCSGPIKATKIITKKVRDVLTSYPSPQLPVWKPKFGSGRLLNAAALLTNFLKH